MGSVQASIELYDRMSRPLNAIMNAINHTMISMQSLQGTMDSAMDTSSIDDVRDALIDAQREVDALSQEFENAENSINNNTNAQQDFNTQLDMGISGAQNLENAIQNVVGAIGGMMAIKEVTGFIQDATDAANAQNAAEVQLQATMRNMGNANYYDEIIKKAQDIQANGIYGDEAMIGAAAEFSTYMTDPEAIKTMMDTLTNYAAGMTGGGAVGNEEMVNFATNLGKITTGAYDAMTKKGFEFTEAQKAVLKGSATEAQYIEALGADYKNLSGDMQQAQIISDVINESWAGMYEAMSNTPEASIIQFNNSWGDMNETIGNQLYPSVSNLFDTINSHIPEIQSFISEGATVLGNVISDLADIVDWASQNKEIVEQTLVTLGTVLATYLEIKTAIELAKSVQMAFNGACDSNPWLALASVILFVANNVLIAKNATEEYQNSVINNFQQFLFVVLMVLTSLVYPIAVVATTVIGAGQTIADAFTYAFFWCKSKVISLCADMLDAIAPVLDAISWLTGVQVDTYNLRDQASLAAYELEKVDFSDNFDGLKNAISEPPWSEEYQDYMSNLAENGAKGMLGLFGITGTQDDGIAHINGSVVEGGITDITDTYNWNGGGGSVGDAIVNNTGRTADALEITNENLKYLREAAETSAINRYTIAEIKVDMTNNNNISSGMDIDGVVETLSNGVQEAMEQAAEGVY